jgi:GT2 family glycosyltransferase
MDVIHDYADEHLNVRSNKKNVGVIGVNQAVEMSKGRYVVDINSDMIVLPGWDMALIRKLRKLEAMGEASVSACLIEPYPGNPEYNYHDFGTSPEVLRYEALMHGYAMYLGAKKDTVQFSHPIMMHRELWDAVGGISEGFPFPGMCTDVDLGFKLLKRGARTVMCGDALVYHFSSATLKRMRSEGTETPPGVQEFIEKHGEHPDALYEKFQVRKEFLW